VDKQHLDLHHYSAPAQASLLIREFLTKHETTVVPPAALLSRFGPCRLFLVPEGESSLKGCGFQTVEEREENLIWGLCAIPQNMFQVVFQNWKMRWERCIKSGKQYFEGDKFKL